MSRRLWIVILIRLWLFGVASLLWSDSLSIVTAAVDAKSSIGNFLVDIVSLDGAVLMLVLSPLRSAVAF